MLVCLEAPALDHTSMTPSECDLDRTYPAPFGWPIAEHQKM